VAIVQKVGWDHLFLLAIPTHHSVGPPAFVGHIDGDYTCETKFDWAVEGFTVSKMVVQIGMVQVLVFATGLFVLSKDLSVGIFCDPTVVVEKERPVITSDQVVDTYTVAHGSKNVDRHASGVFADHLDIVGQIASIWPLPNAAHTDDTARIEQIASLHDASDSVDE
jgi:hypothetical protein